MKNSTKSLGNAGEKAAADFLKNHGLKVVEQNYQNHIGEIDIICEDKDDFVFVEVKSKTGNEFGFGYEMVNEKKKRKLINLASSYFSEKGIEGNRKSYRIDIVSVDLNTGKIDWYKNAVEDF